MWDKQPKGWQEIDATNLPTKEQMIEISKKFIDISEDDPRLEDFEKIFPDGFWERRVD